MTLLTRRAALGALFAVAPSALLARTRQKENAWPGYRGGISVDVSALRRNGDNTDADFLASALPGYLAQSFGAGHNVEARIDSVTYGVGGSDGRSGNNGAIDTIEGVGRVNGREVPLTCSLVATVYNPDIDGYGARLRQDMLARSFAQWLPRQFGN